MHASRIVALFTRSLRVSHTQNIAFKTRSLSVWCKPAIREACIKFVSFFSHAVAAGLFSFTRHWTLLIKWKLICGGDGCERDLINQWWRMTPDLAPTARHKIISHSQKGAIFHVENTQTPTFIIQIKMRCFFNWIHSCYAWCFLIVSFHFVLPHSQPTF